MTDETKSDQFYIRNFDEKGYLTKDDSWKPAIENANTFSNEQANQIVAEYRKKDPHCEIEILSASGQLFDFYEDAPITKDDEIRYPAEDGEIYFVTAIQNPDGVEREYLALVIEGSFDPVVKARDANWVETEFFLSDTDMNYLVNLDLIYPDNQSEPSM